MLAVKENRRSARKNQRTTNKKEKKSEKKSENKFAIRKINPRYQENNFVSPSRIAQKGQENKIGVRLPDPWLIDVVGAYRGQSEAIRTSLPSYLARSL